MKDFILQLLREHDEFIMFGRFVLFGAFVLSLPLIAALLLR